jgi:hypothetical protein
MSKKHTKTPQAPSWEEIATELGQYQDAFAQARREAEGAQDFHDLKRATCRALSALEKLFTL